jgi:hypothetical protein
VVAMYLWCSLRYPKVVWLRYCECLRASDVVTVRSGTGGVATVDPLVVYSPGPTVASDVAL